MEREKLQENYWTLCCISICHGTSFTYDWASGWWSLGALGLSQQFKIKPYHPFGRSHRSLREGVVAEESTCRCRTQSRLLCSSFHLEEVLDFTPGWMKGQQYLLLLCSPQWVQKNFLNSIWGKQKAMALWYKVSWNQNQPEYIESAAL